MNPAVRVTRDVPASEEHNYLGRDVKEGEIFYRFNQHTYGCVRFPGVALSVEQGEYPFFEFPGDAVEDIDDRAGYKGMGTA